MCEICGKVVNKLRIISGKFWCGLVENFYTLNFVCKNYIFSTNFYQYFPKTIRFFQLHKILWFSPLSTSLTMTTKLNKGVQ